MANPRDIRLTELREMLDSRTNAEGKAIRGYATNVNAIKDEIARLTALPADAKTLA